MGRVCSLLAVALLVAGRPRAQAKAMKWMDATRRRASGRRARWRSSRAIPARPATFTVRIRMPANYAVPPHHHPGDEVVRVVSAGALSYGMGDKLDRGQRRLADQGLSRHHGRGHEPLCVHHRPGRGPGQRDGPVPDHLRRPEGRPADEVADGRAVTRSESDVTSIAAFGGVSGHSRCLGDAFRRRPRYARGCYFTSSTCSNSSSTGVARPKMDTETFTRPRSKSSSSTSPLKLANGPSSTLTLSPIS